MAQSELTVTPVGPTPPTNFNGFVGERPPNVLYTAAADDGTAGALTAIAAVTAGVNAEARGTEVVVTAPGSRAECPTVSLSVLGNYTSNPNADHASGKAPSVAPTITGLVPATTLGTGGTMSLTVNGTGFRQNSVVVVNGVPMATNYISATQLSAQNVPKRTSAGTLPVTVVTGGVATSATNWTFT